MTPPQMPRGNDLFWSKVIFTPNGCWLWTGYRNKDGYAKSNGRYVHRLVWAAANGPIPAGLQIDHVCRTRNCLNPDHMEIVTKRVNTLRGTGFAAVNSRKTHCVHGHEFTAANTYHPRGDERRRQCRECSREANRRRYRSRVA